MSPLVTGSLAFDCLMHISGQFGDRWPAQPEGSFSVAYTAPSLARTLGGCAGNIAYGLHKLGESPLIMATAGNDFTAYADYLHQLGISTEHIMILPDFYTAQAYIVTDQHNSQFIVFHPGAVNEAHRQSVTALPPPPLAIVAPNGKDGMLKHCRELAAARTPFIFDPGQAISLFSGDELRECLTLAPYAIFNRDEFAILEKASGLRLNDAAELTEALFITHGEHGSKVIVDNDVIQTDCVHLGETKDPTGCGDAYRAGLMVALLHGWDWLPLLHFASIVAAIKAMHGSGQGYEMSLSSAAAAYEKTFHKPLPAL